MLKITFIINGMRRLTPATNRLINECEAHPELEVKRLTTTKQKDAIQFARNSSNEGVDFLIAIGGDGTLNEILNGALKSDKPTPVLGLIPAGTGNDFVHSTGFQWDKKMFINAIVSRITKTIDIGRIENNDSTHYFINIADVGFGGKAIQFFDRQRGMLSGNFSYNVAIFRTFFTFRRPIMSVRSEKHSYQGEVLMVAVCNGRVFGNGLIINPDAIIDDGKFSVTLLGKVSLWDYVRRYRNLRKGIRVEHPEVAYFETDHIEIDTLQGTAYSEMDGEFLETGNISFTILPKQIDLLKY